MIKKNQLPTRFINAKIRTNKRATAAYIADSVNQDKGKNASQRRLGRFIAEQAVLLLDEIYKTSLT